MEERRAFEADEKKDGAEIPETFAPCVACAGGSLNSVALMLIRVWGDYSESVSEIRGLG